MEIGLSLGSNLGDRLENLKQSRKSIFAVPGLSVVASSAVYETDPVDVSPEYAGMPFLNAVLVISTDVDTETLLDCFISIEKKMGRRRGNDRNSPRPIDIDIIYAGAIPVKTAKTEIPHPRWAQRRFVVQLLCDLRPDLRLPGESRTVREVLLALPPTPKVILFGEQW